MVLPFERKDLFRTEARRRFPSILSSLQGEEMD
jgi:hypothetical protein